MCDQGLLADEDVVTPHTATYSPEDNKLRLYTAFRLDRETYDRLRAAGFVSAPKQGCIVAPAWTPAREDLLLELCGDIGDEDTTLTERAEQRADRFEGYSDRRASEARQAKAAVDSIMEHIPLGQPILVGHHSERRARKDAERIEGGMRRAVKLWDTADYWTRRADGAIRAAKYKEMPAVRHRRIKTIEADQRRAEREKEEAAGWLKLWSAAELTLDQARAIAGRCWLTVEREAGKPYGTTAYDVLRDDPPRWTVEAVVEVAQRAYPAAIARAERWIAHCNHRLAYERAMLAAALGLDEATENAMASRWDLEPGGRALIAGEWLVILRVNKTGETASSVTTTPPRGVTWTSQWKHGIEKIKDYAAPTKADSDKVKETNKLPPLCNYPGEGFREMTKADWSARNQWSDFTYVHTLKATDTAGTHRVRQMPAGGWKAVQVYITDMPTKRPPAPPTKSSGTDIAFAALAVVKSRAVQLPPPRTEADDLRDVLKAGIHVVAVPHLFVTPDWLADEVIGDAMIRPGHLVLEPQAGTGALASRAADRGATVDCVEVNAALSAQLEAAGRYRRVIAADFLTLGAEPLYDRIVMNPPFDHGIDVDHVVQALNFLKPDGCLVAIMSAGVKFHTSARARTFRDRMEALKAEWSDLPAGTFAGTQVRTVAIRVWMDGKRR
ncbi:DUF3560 domain-containing protein [Azospirillum tabaci]|uniref:DUF3560 domain-containing protein n=1 Tax=Azospirillum tabaci TaxID=2752310 RepID=UPI001B3B4E2A|nr:DUF3560 domain-containing protein [Azospirillum tabaci]